MRTFYFLRHGQTDWNVEGRYQGSRDIPLNANGIAQALIAAAHYTDHPVDRIISSPLMRAQATAQAIADRLRVPVEIDVRLSERNFGSFEGLTLAEVEAGDPEVFYDHALPNDWLSKHPVARGSETLKVVADRAEAAVLDNLAKYPDEKLLFVAHGAWFRALMHRLCGDFVHSDNATPYIFSPPERPDAQWLVQAAIQHRAD